MKTAFLTKILMVALLITYKWSNSQILFSENFETSPVESILNTINSETKLKEGTPPCGLAARGNTSNFNSTKIDFKNSANSTYFLGVNPESPCGGYYDAELKTATLNFSGKDSLRFKCRYFKSNTLGWGSANLQVILTTGTQSDTIKSEFTKTNNWEYLDVALPKFLISSTVTIKLIMGGGEGIAIDDIEVKNFPIKTGIDIIAQNKSMSVYPNPFFSDFHVELNAFDIVNTRISIAEASGNIIYVASPHEITNGKFEINLSGFSKGLYFITFKSSDLIKTIKVVKE